MKSKTPAIQSIPTNIITGFLGVGKTSAILHLLKLKPKHERWAVLVNEFGEIGVDGSIIDGQNPVRTDVFIREVPGGCMCCAAGVPMQVALNQLLAKAKPDRLLIEPTGLGHPQEVQQVLSTGYYHDLLSLQRTITFIDARKLSDQRYTNHEIFNQQILIADIVIGNKVDLYKEADKENLVAYVNQLRKSQTEILFTQQGEIPFSTLEAFSTKALESTCHHHHYHENSAVQLVSETPIPDCGFIRAINEGEGYSSVGWRFAPEIVFKRQRLLSLLMSLHVERVKAVFITNEGAFGYNLTPDGVTESPLHECSESRIEIISGGLDDSLEARLLECL